jgi:hypothetical protein
MVAGWVQIDLTGLPAVAPNDADLYVSTTELPNASSYECRPFKASGADESCLVYSAAGQVGIAVNGFHAGEIAFTLTATPVNDSIFADGFESGNTSKWSSAVP